MSKEKIQISPEFYDIMPTQTGHSNIDTFFIVHHSSPLIETQH